MNASKPNNSHTFNSIGPAGYFITFHTYGTWLHGDIRGSIERHGQNIPGTPMIEPDSSRVQFEMSRLKQPPVRFNLKQRQTIQSTMVEIINYNTWQLHAINVRVEHIHVVLTAQKSPEKIMNQFKSWSTRKMRENNLWKSKKSPWSRHGSTRYLWNEKEINDACKYVLYGQDT